MTELLVNLVRAEWIIGAIVGMYFSYLKISRSKRRLRVFQRLPHITQLERRVVEIVIRGNIRKGRYFFVVHLSFFAVGLSGVFVGSPLTTVIAAVLFPLAQGLLVADLIQTRSEELHVIRHDARTGAINESGSETTPVEA